LKKTLLIFLKYPEPGSVKTRLAKSIGKNKTTGLYKTFAEKILKNIKGVSYESIICFTPRDKEQATKRWLGKNIKLLPQKGKDLGERLGAAFQYAFGKGSKYVIAIGTDSPLLNKRTITQSFKELEKHDAVIGPSMDGGYYLIGLSKFYSDVFKRIDWGTNKVFNETIKHLKKLKIKTKIMPKHFDVDKLDDLFVLKNILTLRFKSAAKHQEAPKKNL